VDSVGSDLAALRESILETVAAAEEVEDRGTANLLDDLLDAIEKDQWMLRSWKKEAARS